MKDTDATTDDNELTNTQAWAGGRAEALDAISDAVRFLGVNMPDDTILLIERALVILRKQKN